MTLSDFDKFFVGSDRLVNELTKLYGSASASPTYPPFNLKKTNEQQYALELAVAGLSKADIELTLDDNKLIIKGTAPAEVKDNPWTYIHRGIANRSFIRTFTLADNVQIKDASLQDGMLKVFLEVVIPESKKPRKIELSGSPKSFLTE